MDTHVAEIIDFEIQQLDADGLQPTISGAALSAVLKLQIGAKFYRFGGRNLFASVPNAETLDFTGFFILRCMQVLRVSKSSAMVGEIIKVCVDGDKVVGITSLGFDDFFYPVEEFENLANGENDED
ncbi:hypothetical protein DYBT9623_00668 [Dyadobacter sp. CECT 9623]|uniref:Uncharacterized protein n=1 Tax=Dyadobacter linearis TaxID=2823330 RepID=A0ABN7R6D7_9BACT|nr:hypothetical protein [Dyadobacter sp. CECT 9623]CAG5067940.1 hypothetical protein DYBT9623_00668 [Dyadobacter sp. CECT 9623]